MSRGLDSDYKPTLPIQKPKQPATDRPKRNSRKQVNYTEPVITLDEEADQPGTSKAQLVNTTPGERYSKGAREVRALLTESVCGSSDRSECWSPDTVQARTKVLSDGIEELKLQLGNIRMVKKEELSVTDLMAMMLEMSRKDKEDARKREEEREERAIEREEKRLREQADREDERRKQEEEREEKRLQNRKDREEERRREDNIREERRIEREERDKQVAAEREVQLLATLKAAQPTVPQTVHLDSTKLPVMCKGEDIELFLELFESALVAGGGTRGQMGPETTLSN